MFKVFTRYFLFLLPGYLAGRHGAGAYFFIYFSWKDLICLVLVIL